MPTIPVSSRERKWNKVFRGFTIEDALAYVYHVCRYYGRRSILPIALKLRFTPLERQQVVWCALRSATFVIISAAQSIPGTTVYTTLVDAALNQLTMLEQMGDGPIANGAYDRLGPGNIALHVWNTNNHQITRGVLSAALDALADYVETRFAGALSFYIYDGDNEVGQGLIGLSG